MFAVGKRSLGALERITIAEAHGDDPAAVVIVSAIEPKMRRRALHAARRLLEEMEVPATADLAGDLLLDVSEEVSRELLRLVIVGIEGIADETTGEAFTLTPDLVTRLRTANDKGRPEGTIDDLLADERIFAKLDAEIVIPDARRRAEKNASSGSPPGTSTGATPGKGTANFRAKRTSRAGARNARTKKTRSKPTKAKGSGTS